MKRGREGQSKALPVYEKEGRQVRPSLMKPIQLHIKPHWKNLNPAPKVRPHRVTLLTDPKAGRP